MDTALQTLTDVFAALRYPLDDPGQTLIAVLVLVVAGLLVAVVLIALASPGRDVDDAHSAPDTSNADEHAREDMGRIGNV